MIRCCSFEAVEAVDRYGSFGFPEEQKYSTSDKHEEDRDKQILTKRNRFPTGDTSADWTYPESEADEQHYSGEYRQDAVSRAVFLDGLMT